MPGSCAIRTTSRVDLHHWHMHPVANHIYRVFSRHAAWPGASSLPALPHWQLYQFAMGLLCMHHVQLAGANAVHLALDPQHCHLGDIAAQVGIGCKKVPASADVMLGMVMCLTFLGMAPCCDAGPPPACWAAQPARAICTWLTNDHSGQSRAMRNRQATVATSTCPSWGLPVALAHSRHCC